MRDIATSYRSGLRIEQRGSPKTAKVKCVEPELLLKRPVRTAGTWCLFTWVASATSSRIPRGERQDEEEAAGKCGEGRERGNDVAGNEISMYLCVYVYPTMEKRHYVNHPSPR